MDICSLDKCTGCGYCFNACPVVAITMEKNLQGFMYPVVDTARCINCKQCQRGCPVNCTGTIVSGKIHNQKVFAAFSNDNSNRRKSSSGGVFGEIAKAIISCGGAVVASRFSDDYESVCFDICERIEELPAYQGSKYVQSLTNDVFQRTKNLLLNGRKVLFVGTGCQVAALKSYLGKDYNNLYCADIICHGVPSPELWKRHLRAIREKNGNKEIKYISFRNKEISWREFSLVVEFVDGSRYFSCKSDDPYIIGFTSDITLRESCYNCHYANLQRQGDITLADFWGYKSENYKMRNDEKGISLVIQNTAKGKQMLGWINSQITFCEKTMQEAVNGNQCLKEPFKKSPLYYSFWGKYANGEDSEALLEEFCKPFKVSDSMKAAWKRDDHYYIYKYWLRVKKIIKQIKR